jgi:broad specificity phosphatase PhoE
MLATLAAISDLAALEFCRHGRTKLNGKRERAEQGKRVRVEFKGTDHASQLCELGHAQAKALGEWWRKSKHPKPDVIVVSRFTRTEQTADDLIAAAGWADSEYIRIPLELIRDRDVGEKDGFTRYGWAESHPEDSKAEKKTGTLIHRRKGAESRYDQMFRLRYTLLELMIKFKGKRVLFVTHDSVCIGLHSILQNLDEKTWRKLKKKGVPNGSLTSFTRNEQGVLEPTKHPMSKRNLINFSPRVKGFPGGKKMDKKKKSGEKGG